MVGSQAGLGDGSVPAHIRTRGVASRPSWLAGSMWRRCFLHHLPRFRRELARAGFGKASSAGCGCGEWVSQFNSVLNADGGVHWARGRPSATLRAGSDPAIRGSPEASELQRLRASGAKPRPIRARGSVPHPLKTNTPPRRVVCASSEHHSPGLAVASRSGARQPLLGARVVSLPRRKASWARVAASHQDLDENWFSCRMASLDEALGKPEIARPY